MEFAMFQFNARTVNPDQTPEPIAAGRYRVAIAKSNLKETKAKDGAMIDLRFNVLDGPFQGRQLNTNLNVFNKNPTAVEIALKELSAIGHCVNVLDIAGQDGAVDNYLPMLHNLPFLVDVTVEDGYNRIKKYFDVNGNAPGAQNGQQPQQQQPQQVAPPPPQQYQQPQQQPPAQNWGAPPAQQPMQQPPAQQPMQQPPAQNWQQQPATGAPPAGNWGAPPQQPPAQQPAPAGNWGAPPQQPQQPPATGAPSWGR
jgi:hypothetical protein